MRDEQLAFIFKHILLLYGFFFFEEGALLRASNKQEYHFK